MEGRFSSSSASLLKQRQSALFPESTQNNWQEGSDLKGSQKKKRKRRKNIRCTHQRLALQQEFLEVLEECPSRPELRRISTGRYFVARRQVKRTPETHKLACRFKVERDGPAQL